MNRKGFTLVELLAAIAILAVLVVATVPSVANLIKKSKEEHDDNIIDTVIMATKSYVQDNKKDVPKYIGSKKTVFLQTLLDRKYLKEELKNSADDVCDMNTSYVEVFKKDTQKYVYIPYIECAGKTIEGKNYKKPSINIFLTDNEGKEVISTDAPNDISISKIRVTMFGGNNVNGNSDKKVCNNKVRDGYGLIGYSIFVYKYTSMDDSNDEYVEVYNSGSLRANDKKCLTAEVDLAKYLDLTQGNKLKIVVRANNEYGGESTERYDAKFDDEKGPTCGNVRINEPKKGEWSNSHERKIGIECIDDGSGCQQKYFWNTFNKEGTTGIIKIKDNRGNETPCKVNVYLDWTKPTVKIKTYKLKVNKENGKKVAEATVNDTNSPCSLKKYTDGYGDDSWLNNAKFPYGITYSLDISDNYTLDTGNWSLNAKNLTEDSKKKTKLSKVSSQTFTKKKGSFSFEIIDEGYRYGNFIVSDKAGNKTEIRITAPIDRTPPSVPTVKMYEKNSATNLNKNSNLSSLSKYSNNTWINKWVFTKAVGSTDAISGFDHYEYTVTGAATNVTNQKGSCKNINKQGISYIKYKAFDKAGNSSNDSASKTIKLDRKAPKCINVAKKINASGENYTSGNWYNENIYTSAKCSESRAVSDDVDVSGCSATKKVTTTGSTGERKEAELANYTVTQEGESTTQWFVFDKAGNRGDCNKITERVDKTPPTMTWSHGAGTHDNNDGITVTVTCTDENDGSGIKDSGTSKKIASPSTNVTFSYICTDRAGNPTPGSRTFSVRKYSADSSCGQYDCNPHSCLYDCTIMMYAFCNDPKYKKFKEAEGASVYSACTTVDKADDRTKTGKYCYKTCYEKCNNTCWHF